MLSLEQLSALDLRAWLGSQQEASVLLGISQSHVCRVGQQSLALLRSLRLDPQQPAPHLLHDSLGLLDRLREIHQIVRFRDGSGLRLQTTCWLRQLVLDPLPEGWLANVAAVDRSNDCEALPLLEHRILDAALVTGPECPPDDHPCLLSLEISRQPLMLLVPERHPLAGERGLSAAEISAASELGFSRFVHQLCRRGMEGLDRLLLGATPDPSRLAARAEPPALARRYGTAMTTLVRPDLVRLDFAVPYPARDVLVVHRDWIDHPAITSLVGQLRQRLEGWRRRIPGLEVVA